MLIRDHELVLATRIAEPRDGLPVRRPARRTLRRAWRAREIARVAFLGRHGEDLTARFEDRALTGGREHPAPHASREVFPVRPRPREVAAYVDRQRLWLHRGRVHHEERAAVLEDEAPAPLLEVLDVELPELRHLRQRAARGVIGPDVDGVVAVGKEVDLPVEEDRLHVVRAVPRQLRDREGLEIDPLDRLVLAAPVVPPLALPGLHHLVGDRAAVRRDLAAPRARERHRRGQSPIERDGPELRVRNGRSLARGGEDDALAVRRPATRRVRQRVPGQALRFATGRRDDVDVRVTVVARLERDPLAVGRELRRGLDAGEAGQTPGISSIAPGDPEIAAVAEHHVAVADVRKTQEARRRLRHRKGQKQQGRDQGEQDRSSSQLSSFRGRCAAPRLFWQRFAPARVPLILHPAPIAPRPAPSRPAPRAPPPYEAPDRVRMDGRRDP